MSRLPREPLMSSLLDRLITTDQRRDAARLEESVRRDLENLLNTRWRCLNWPPNLEELEQSLVNYGIPDFTGASFNDPGSQRDLRRIIQSAIRRFEPRLGAIKVSVPERPDRRDRTVRFRIEAELGEGRHRTPIAFETALDPSTATFRVGQAGR